MGANFDFSGWATRNDMECADGRIIRRDAFKENDGKQVSLVWNHQHDSVDNVLGHAILENRAEGVYAYCYLNDTPSGNKAKEAIIHGDVNALSIYANKLKQTGCNVMHGCIKEVSLVLAGANPGAYIETVNIAHSFSGELVDEEAIIFNDVYGVNLAHAEEKEKEAMAENNANEKTVQDVLDTFTDEQKTVMYAIIGEALKNAGVDEYDNEGDNNMKHNVFDIDEAQGNVLTHSDEAAIFASAKKYGSLKDASEDYLEHTLPNYGIEHIDYLFPEATNLNTTPEFIKRDTDWVSVIMNGVKHTPFSRVRSTFANITMDEARARGYIKGKQKKEEAFTLLKRTTDPQTIYKKQKMDRDDIVDITDFNVVSWLKTEMRMMLDEEIARAILIGDGRLSSDDDKISEDHIRSVANDASLYSISKTLNLSDISSLTAVTDLGEFIATNIMTASGANTLTPLAEQIISTVVMARVEYKGTGNPICFMPEALLAMMLLVKDANGRRIYTDENDLAKAMRVAKIVTCPLLDSNLSAEGKPVLVIFNPADYNVGADKGGAVNMFEDFDIDYNQQKYLIETRCSGALVKPYSAIVIKNPVNE